MAPEGATWCEACGHELAAATTTPCTDCGERSISPDGYCLTCGHRQPRERDHVVLIDGPVVAVSDRGRRHRHNEDSVAIGHTDRGVVLVVCDGVSSTPGSDEASSRAATAACDVLVDGLRREPVVPVPDLLVEAVEAAQMEAASAADGVLASGGAEQGDGPPSSTLVAVVAIPLTDDRTEFFTAWVGDSRAYWVAARPEGTRRLTGDDHAISGSLIRWLGADSMDPVADIESVIVAEPGHVIVCSDGLWRYADQPAALGSLVADLVEGGRHGVDLAEALVDHANVQGGHDNISVALWSNLAIEPADPTDPEPADHAEPADPADPEPADHADPKGAS